MAQEIYRSGFVHLVGKPNAGKSTLFNTLVKTPLSIVTHKPQTTRQELIGIVNTPYQQITYVDTPGYITPKYSLQKFMVKSIQQGIPGSDLLLWVVDARTKEVDRRMLDKISSGKCVFLVLNKIDLLTDDELRQAIDIWDRLPIVKKVIPISARKKMHLEKLITSVEQVLPEHPAFYHKNDISDKPLQFFIAEIIRKVIFTQYHQEIPYTTAVNVTNYQEKEDLIYVDATIYTERMSQKKILIGKKGLALQKLCISVRSQLSSFLNKKIFFKPYIKILPNWREKPNIFQHWPHV